MRRMFDFSMLTSTHLEIYMNFLSGYYADEKYYSNSSRAKARKLSAVISLPFLNSASLEIYVFPEPDK